MTGIDWTRGGKASVLVGGQFGSEGKGLAAAWLARMCGPVDIATTNAGAQAGHTTKFRDGQGFVCYHLPTTGVIQNDQHCLSYINAGSIIDIEALLAEIEATGVDSSRVIIHPRAAVITAEMKAAEREQASSTAKIASTQKGVGAALSGKIMRKARLAGEWPALKPFIRDIGCLNAALSVGDRIVVEVPQGTDLSINHGMSYPYCTSRDCTVANGLADAGIHPSFVGPVCMVIRTMPIRVGSLHNENGELIGSSGPFYPDSVELDWARDLPGVEPERTTVTKRIRRIASWSIEQYAHGLRINRPTITFLNFCNYLGGGHQLWSLIQDMRSVEEEMGLTIQHVFGFGPCVEDVTAELGAAMAWYDGCTF